MKQVLLLGDQASVTQPLEQMQCRLQALFEGRFAIETMEDYGGLTHERLKPYALVICCFGADWAKKSSRSLTAAFLSYVVNGGCLLGFHDAIASTANHEMCYLWGASASPCPPAGLLDYAPAQERHLVLDEASAPFTVEDAPLRFDFNVFTKNRKILYTYTYGAERYPAAWSHTYGAGRVVYLAPGLAPAWENAAFRRLVLRCGLWGTNLL